MSYKGPSLQKVISGFSVFHLVYRSLLLGGWKFYKILAVWKEHEFWHQLRLSLNHTPPLKSCMAQTRLLNLSEPVSSSVKWE